MSLEQGYEAAECCDICWSPEGEELSDIVTCVDCRVRLHPTCYNLGEEEAKKARTLFRCWACQAVGKTVEFRERNEQGIRLQKLVKTRPSDCVLCGTADARVPHALHPLFDDYGKRARQLRSPDGDGAWVHTLCALTVSIQTGCLVYGCTRDGDYFGSDEGDAGRIKQDDESINPLLDVAEGDGTVTHFVFVLEKWYGRKSPYALLWKRHIPRGCIHCGETGEGEGIYRVALQCMANHRNELREFTKRKPHKLLSLVRGCQLMMHVGCARYYQRVPGKYPSSRSVYFYPPGSSYGDWAFNIFCPEHAEDLVKADFPDASLVCYPVASKVTAVANGTTEPQLPQSNNAAVAGSTSAKKRRRIFEDDDDDDEASLEDAKPAAARSSATIGVHSHRQVADNIEDNENAGLPAHTCRGVTLDSLVAEREFHPSAMQQVVGRLMSQAVHTRALPIRHNAWPLTVAEWHGALFRSEKKEPWCKVKARQGVTGTGSRRYFALHGGACTGMSRQGVQCEACLELVPLIMAECRVQENTRT